jgi:hypothetical protein
MTLKEAVVTHIKILIKICAEILKMYQQEFEGKLLQILRNFPKYFSEWTEKQVDLHELCLSPAGRIKESFRIFTQEHNDL